MPSTSNTAVRRLLIWAVATASSLETFLQAIDAAVNGNPQSFIVWATGSPIAFLLAFTVEKFKLLGGE